MDSESAYLTDRMRYFWVLAGLIALLCAAPLTRDVDRSFYGLHSVDQAHNAWLARSHVTYGLGYTKGFPTFAVGSPPAEVAQRYLDHPVLYALLDAGGMAILGVNTWALRVTNVIATIMALFVFLRIVRGLSNDPTALLAGLVFVQLPLITYFGVNQWLYPLCFLAIWCYMVLIRALKDGPGPAPIHIIGLAVLLFVTVQIQWQGFFFALALGVHYASRCLRRREWPRRNLLAVLVILPMVGVVLNFLILAAGDNWNFGRLVELVEWRAGSGEREVHEWGPWFARLWEFALTNFTWGVLIIALAYLTVGQLLLRLGASRGGRVANDVRRFPQFWLFLMPGIFQLFLLKGVVWEHQWWERPLVPLISIMTALGLLMLGDLLRKMHRGLAHAGIAVGVGAIIVSTFLGTNHYYGLRYYYPERLEMFESLRDEIPRDKALLSFESYLFDQKPGVKPASYWPEVGWHLDREIVVARTLEEIESQARTGRFPYYLMPVQHRREDVNRYLAWLSLEMRNRYTSRRVRANPDQWVFDLQAPKNAPP
jgi:4-amino-4-deoxy-L-arabinose transferase-like glycosyltransferase